MASMTIVMALSTVETEVVEMVEMVATTHKLVPYALIPVPMALETFFGVPTMVLAKMVDLETSSVSLLVQVLVPLVQTAQTVVFESMPMVISTKMTQWDSVWLSTLTVTTRIHRSTLALQTSLVTALIKTVMEPMHHPAVAVVEQQLQHLNLTALMGTTKIKMVKQTVMTLTVLMMRLVNLLAVVPLVAVQAVKL
jgi:hypothetical protein